MSEPLSLTTDECISLNKKLNDAVAQKQSAALLDIIDALSVSEVKGKLKVWSEQALMAHNAMLAMAHTDGTCLDGAHQRRASAAGPSGCHLN